VNISTNLGSTSMIFEPGRMQRVIVQANHSGRMQIDETLGFHAQNNKGQLVPFSSFASIKWTVGPTLLVGFNYHPSVRISGSARPGYERRRDRRDGAYRRHIATRFRL
jgi:multidrug efflux pump